MRPIAFLLSATLVIGPACGGGPAASGAEGVEGIVMLGPTCPVQRQGQVCERPFETDIQIAPAGGGAAITAHAGADGRFSVALAPGSYVVRATSGGIGGRGDGSETPFTVVAGSYTSVVVSVDSGIR